MTNEKIYISTQLAMMLPAQALKVFYYILSWQSQALIKFYKHQWCRFLHMTVQEVELSLQTLSDRNLISISKIDDTYCITLEADVIKKYFNVPLTKIAENEGFPMANEVTFNKSQQTATKKEEDMTVEQMQKMMVQLQEKIKAATTNDDLPW